MRTFIIAIVALVWISLGVWWQIGLWDECRQTNSWGYCMKVLSR